MTHNLKALGLTMVTALAMAAMVASAAQAEGSLGTFTGGDTNRESPIHATTNIHGAQTGVEAENFFRIEGEGGLEIRCENTGVTYTGHSATGTETSLTITPSYKDCKGIYGEASVPATVTMNGCDYTFRQPATIEPLGTGKYTGKVGLTCEEGKQIEIELYLFGSVTSHSTKFCTIDVFADEDTTSSGGKNYWHETLSGHVIYQNGASGGKDDVTATVTAQAITWKKTNGACPGGLGEGHDGVLRSNVTMTGKGSKGGLVDFWVSD